MVVRELTTDAIPPSSSVLLIYVYLIAYAFLVGIQLDANVRERA